MIELFDYNIKKFTALFNKIYASGVIQFECLKLSFVFILKRQYPKDCGDYPTIGLIRHFLKLFLRIIHHRIRAKSVTKCS